MNRLRYSAPARGFTLIELLVGLVLIGITLAIAFAALRFAGRSQERTDDVVREAEEIRVAYSVIQRQLAQARPLILLVPQRHPAFRGDADALEFVAPVPSQAGRLAGLYHYRLHLVATQRGVDLVLDHQPYMPSRQFEWPEQHDSTVLVRGLAAGNFSYYNGTTGNDTDQWTSQWDVTEALPSLVRVRLERAPGAVAWPELIVPLRAYRVR